MDANRKKDIAKDFAEFLLKEKKQSDGGVAPSVPAQSDVYELPVIPDVNSIVKGPQPQLTTVKAGEESAVNPSPTQQSVPSKPILSSAPKQQTVQAVVPVPKENVFDEVNKIVGQVESIRAAQLRIQNLESERDELRNEASRLLIMCEELNKTLLETKEKHAQSLLQLQNQMDELIKEKKSLGDKIKIKESELAEVKEKNSQLEGRFADELKKVRTKEREYENINMIMKAEAQAVARAKDEMILDLKRKADQLTMELEMLKATVSKNQAKMEAWSKRHSEALNLLRQGVHVLDGEDAAPKKASGDEKN